MPRPYPRVERRIVALRQSRQLGPARLAGTVGMPASTVHRVLVRDGMNRLGWLWSGPPGDRSAAFRPHAEVSV